MLTAEQTRTTIDRSTFTITFKRKLAASPEAVFDAWTRSEQISAWWDPDGVSLRECSIDLRVGGEFKLVNSGHSPPFAGAYRVIERPEMTVTIRSSGPEHLEQFVKLGVADGTARTLDNLVTYVAPRSAPVVS